MITKTHQKGEAFSTAIYSDCLVYRYSLTRVWNPEWRKVNFVMLNPSTATEVHNDPTIERCEQRARALGFGAICITNIFAWRDTDPKKMRAAADPVGVDNDTAIRTACTSADQVIAAWGTHGAHLERGAKVAKLLRLIDVPIFHLGLTKAGHPKHPLYLSYATQPQIWDIKPNKGPE